MINPPAISGHFICFEILFIIFGITPGKISIISGFTLFCDLKTFSKAIESIKKNLKTVYNDNSFALLIKLGFVVIIPSALVFFFIKSTDISAGPKFDRKNQLVYGGSSAYWMTMLKSVLIKNKEVNYTYEELIKGAVEAVDRENSTHLNADKCGRTEIVRRICAFDCSELIECLRNPEYEDMKLVHEIARVTSAKFRARTNLSFASKFCHYACFYLFENTEYQDNYSIYDNILRTVLPMYLVYFNITERYDLRDYKQYRNAVDMIRNAADEKISRNGFDHLLWYYHKGRM